LRVVAARPLLRRTRRTRAPRRSRATKSKSIKSRSVVERECVCASVCVRLLGVETAPFISVTYEPCGHSNVPVWRAM
jgi:hypothetical protein